MKVAKYLVSNVIRLVKEEYPDEEPKFYIGDLASALKDRYRFLQAPTKIEDFNLQAGVEFVHGLFSTDKVIGKFRVHNNGVYCEAQQPTEVISEFLDDVFYWARNEIGMRVEDANDPNKFFLSRMEVEADVSFNNTFGRFSAINDRLTELLASYGQESIAFEPVQIGFHCDVTKVETVPPASFSFERRAERSFGENIYYSIAPLSSQDHLSLLNELEALLTV